MRQAELKAKKDAEKAKAEQEKLRKENEDNKNSKNKNKNSENDDDLDLANSAFSPEAMAMINGLKTKLTKMEKMYEKKIEIMNNQIII